jgi:hypothetical protein
MAGRKQLKNLANGLLGTFVSRNNDINGYWGLGLLRLYAAQRSLQTVSIDLLSQGLEKEQISPIDIAWRNYRKWLFEKLSDAGIDPMELRAAEIRIRFTTLDEFPDVRRLTGASLTNVL